MHSPRSLYHLFVSQLSKDFSYQYICNMFSMKKITWAKFTGCTKNDVACNISSKLNVNEEYKEAFRTKSYIEIYGKVQGQLSRANISTLPSTTSSNPKLYMHLSEYLLEPRQETLMDMIESLNIHSLLVDYFKASLEACDICEILLRGVHKTRKSFKKIKRVFKITKRLHEGTIDDDHADDIYKAVFEELAAFALLKNPLLVISPARFRDVHDGNKALLRKLNSESRKLKRRVRFNKFVKKAGGCGLVVSHSVLVVVLLVIALHSVVGILAAPALIGCCFGLKKSKVFKGTVAKEGKGHGTTLLKRVGSQLDVAAKGMYILKNDFDTMSRLVKRLQDEVEHWQVNAAMCIRNGRNEVLKETVKEFFNQEMCFMEQLEELEQHIYLCFLTINKSRRLVLQEILQSENEILS